MRHEAPNSLPARFHLAGIEKNSPYTFAYVWGTGETKMASKIFSISSHQKELHATLVTSSSEEVLRSGRSGSLGDSLPASVAFQARYNQSTKRVIVRQVVMRLM